MDRKLTVVLFGAFGGGVRALQKLLSTGCQVPFIVTTEGPDGDQLATIAAKHTILPLRGRFEQDSTITQDILAYQVDLLISLQYPYRLSKELLEAPAIGAFNIHPSLLPKYPGLYPTKRALAAGEREHGVTIHWMTPQIDAGPIAYQSAFPIKPEHDWMFLLRDSVAEGIRLLGQLIDTASRSRAEIPKIPQPAEP